MKQVIERENLNKSDKTFLIGGLKCEKAVLSTSLIQYYLSLGMVVQKVHAVIEYAPKICFRKFVNDTKNSRIEAAMNEDTSNIIPAIKKKILNSAYGQLLVRRDKHTKLKYFENDKEVRVMMNDARFIDVEQIDTSLYELKMNRTKTVYDNVIQVAAWILNDAKVSLLKIYYDFLIKYLNRDMFQLLFVDTDSAYIALSTSTVEEAIKPNMKGKYYSQLKENCGREDATPENGYYLLRECCKVCNLKDKYTPGKIKIETQGTDAIALSSKCYIVLNNDKISKLASKGVNSRLIQDPVSKYKRALEDKTVEKSVNFGFRHLNNEMLTYKQNKDAFSYIYHKRRDSLCHTATTSLNITLRNAPRNEHLCFFNCFHILGNLYNTPTMYEDITFRNANELFNYRKAIYHDREDIAYKILNGNARTDEIKSIKERLTWYDVEESIMMEVIENKIRNNIKVEGYIRDTKFTKFIYASRDSYYGVGVELQIAKVMQEKEFPGRNVLGAIWESVKKRYK